MLAIQWLTERKNKLIDWLEKRSDYIPFTGLLLWYLRLPFLIKLGLSFLVPVISLPIFYNIGFIILQSKSRNEVLSIATAYQGAVDFPKTLYFIYSFIYLGAVFLTALITYIALFYGLNVLLIKKLKVGSFKKAKVPFWLRFPFSLLILWLAYLIIRYIIPSIPYYALYASKNYPFIELIINVYGRKKSIQYINENYTYDEFNAEVFFSVIIWIFGLVSIVYTAFLLSRVGKEYVQRYPEKLDKFKRIQAAGRKVKIIRRIKFLFFVKRINLFFFQHIVTIYNILIFSILSMILIMQMPFQIGSFGKTLSQFETEYNKVYYLVNGKVRSLEGYKIYQSKSYIIIRDSDNVIHHLSFDELHTVTKIKEPKK